MRVVQFIQFVSIKSLFSLTTNLVSLVGIYHSLAGSRITLLTPGCKNNRAMQVAVGLGVITGREIKDEIGFDGKDCISLKPGVVAREDLGCDGLVAIGRNHEMDMCGTHGMAVQNIQELEARPVGRERVSRRLETVETIAAILLGAELAAQIVLDLILWILEVVLPVGRGFPDVDDGVGDALARL